jgi:hypothetical protein
MILVVRRETQCSTGKWKKVRQDAKERSRQATAEGTSLSQQSLKLWENSRALGLEES